MRRWDRLVALVGLVCLTFGGVVHGDSADLERELGFLEAEDVEKIPLAVASRGPAIPAGQAPAVVDVITAEEIRTSGARTLAELLSQRVGIDVSLDHLVPRGLNTSPSLQGVALFDQRTLLLIDGRPSNGVYFGEFLAGRELPLEHIARIEIIRGPGSALYGTNAMAGVVNVVTKDAADTPGIGIIGEYGSFDTRRVDLFGGMGGPSRNGSFFLRYFGSGGPDQVSRNDDEDELFGFARATLGPITLSGEALSFREETPGLIGLETPNDNVRRGRYSVGASLDQRLGEQFRLGGRVYANLYRTRFIVEEGEPDRTRYDDRRIGEELSLNYRPRDWLSVTFGGEARQENGEVESGGCLDPAGNPQSGCDLDRNVFAAFLEDQVSLPWNLTLTAGFRYDEISRFGSRFSPRANLLWRATPSTALKIGYGEAFRAPSFFELRAAQAFGSDLFGNPNQFVLGNPDLEPEVVRTLEGEVSHRFSRALNLRLAAFHTRGRDLVSQVSRSDLVGLGICPPPTEEPSLPCLIPGLLPPAVTVEELRFINSDRVRIRGFEAAAGGIVRIGLPGEVSWGVNYTLQDGESRFSNPDTGEILEVGTPLAPDHKVNVLVDYRPARELSIFWHTRWVDRQRTGLESPSRLARILSHTLSLVYRPARELEVGVGLYNLFDDDRPEAVGVPREPRAVLGSIAYRWAPAPPLPAIPVPKAEPAELGEARAAIERARAAGAEQLDLNSYREALAHAMIAEEMHRRGEERSRVVAAAERARRSADVARQAAKVLSEPTPSPTPEPTVAPIPTRRGAAAVIPATPDPAGISPTPTAAPSPTPTPTPDVSSRRVLLLQSDSRVAIYGAASAALTAGLGAQVRFHDLAGDGERGREILGAEGDDVDLVVAIGSLAATLAREASAARPLLYCAVLNPERHDLAAANVAGVSFELSAEEQLRTIRDALAGRTRVGVIYDPVKSASLVAEAERAASRIGMRIIKQVASRPEDVGFLFRSLRPEIDVLWLIPDSTVVTRESFELVALHAAESGLPVVAFAEAFARQGALLALYPDPAAVGRQCARLATRILRGEAAPAAIGGMSPDRFACAVNRRIEGQLGLSVPEELCVDVGS